MEGFGKGWNGDAIARFFKNCYGAIGKIDKYQFFFRVNQPAHLSPVGETVENVADDFRLPLVGGKNFDCPVGGDSESVGYFAVFAPGTARRGDDRGASVWRVWRTTLV